MKIFGPLIAFTFFVFFFPFILFRNILLKIDKNFPIPLLLLIIDIIYRSSLFLFNLEIPKAIYSEVLLVEICIWIYSIASLAFRYANPLLEHIQFIVLLNFSDRKSLAETINYYYLHRKKTLFWRAFIVIPGIITLSFFIGDASSNTQKIFLIFVIVFSLIYLISIVGWVFSPHKDLLRFFGYQFIQSDKSLITTLRVLNTTVLANQTPEILSSWKYPPLKGLEKIIVSDPYFQDLDYSELLFRLCKLKSKTKDLCNKIKSDEFYLPFFQYYLFKFFRTLFIVSLINCLTLKILSESQILNFTIAGKIQTLSLLDTIYFWVSFGYGQISLAVTDNLSRLFSIYIVVLPLLIFTLIIFIIGSLLNSHLTFFQHACPTWLQSYYEDLEKSILNTKGYIPDGKYVNQQIEQLKKLSF